MQIHDKSDRIKVKGFIGTWYVIDSIIKPHVNGNRMFLLESEVYGDETPCIIVDEHCNVIQSDIYNGFDDLD